MSVSLDDVAEDLVLIRNRYLASLQAPRQVDYTKCNPYLLATTSTIADFENYEVRSKRAASSETHFGRSVHELFNAIVRKNPDFRLESVKGVDAMVVDIRRKIAYLVAIKSGPNWGNSSQWGQLKKEFDLARKDFLANRAEYRDLESVTMVFHAYGATISAGKRSRPHVDWCIYGQLAWMWVTGGNPTFYLDILSVLALQQSDVEGWVDCTRKACGNFLPATKSKGGRALLKALFEGLV